MTYALEEIIDAVEVSGSVDKPIVFEVNSWLGDELILWVITWLEESVAYDDETWPE